MDVPFVSSGALSRAHYALVRKIETATSSQLADQYILAEVESIRVQLSWSRLTQKQCNECLILLLYCSMNLSTDDGVDLDFALHHAINLAETGQSVQDKKIGYLFCAEIMPPNHELQLMLVNTLRKDLESPEVPRICLALDTLIQFSTEDVIPAVQPRLIDLLSYSSLHIRRRALLAFHSLSCHDPGILREIVSKTEMCLTDPDTVVVSAALTVCLDLINAQHMSSEAFHIALSRILSTTWRSRRSSTKGILIKTLSCLHLVTPSQNDLKVILKMLNALSARGPSAHALLYQCFLGIAKASTEAVLIAQVDSGLTFIQAIRHLLRSEKPNDIYVFLSCLECLDPKLWAGVETGVPAVLEGWEVEHIMLLLDSEDQSIRRKTLRVLQCVDHGIVDTYYVRLVQEDLSPTSARNSDAISQRLLEVIEVICGEDGGMYALHVKDILQAMEGNAPLEKRHVFQGVVEGVLVLVRSAGIAFRSACIGALSSIVVELETPIGPTLMVIITALITEYLVISPVSPTSLLHGLSTRISSYSASIQDACLLCMMRVAAECDEVPLEIVEVVRRLHDQSGRYIRRRCDQFINLALQKGTLKQIVTMAKSAALPDFLAALEKHETGRLAARSPPLNPAQSPGRPRSRSSLSASKLRYDAYEPPKPVPRLRSPSSSSRTSDDGGSRFVGQGAVSPNTLIRTITPGDLALAASGSDLETITRRSPTLNVPLPVVQIMDEDDLASRVDLMAFDSPFVSDPAADSEVSNLHEHDFARTWNSLESFTSRGWCEMSVNEVVRRLQGMRHHVKVISAEQEPFKGDLKVLILSEVPNASNTRIAVLRLKTGEDKGEDEGSLWRMRCDGVELRSAIKAVLSET